ncbi:MAG TPA: FtsX-like permease family protein [Acidimicrobiales bacterium]|nr:FtsX-like permease family protein [Acidimicrobiales bacterium]
MIVLALLVAPVAAIAGISLFDLAARPTFRRLALRNIARRKGEAVLVVLGSLLGTAIITASFVVGDTLDASIRDQARTQLGPVDHVLVTTDLAALPAAEAAVADPVEGTTGTLTIVRSPATVASPPGPDQRAQPQATLLEVDIEAARTFGADPSETGFDGDIPAPGPGQVLLGEDLADHLEVATGEAVEVFAYGSSTTYEVVHVLPRLGVAGYYPSLGSRSYTAFVAPGTLAALAEGAPPGSSPPTGVVAVTTGEGIFGGLDTSAAVTEALEARVADLPGVEVRASKADVVEAAVAQGDQFSQLFVGFGAFSVIAGILLLVNIFVMLAEERKTELGMLRAVGLKRVHLVRSFGLEGAIYAVVAAVAGALMGVGVGRVIVAVTAGLFAGSDLELSLRFAADRQSLVTGALVGLVIGLVTVWGTSIRIGRLNVIRAIRDLPEPTAVHHRMRTLVLSALGVVVGGLIFASGASREEAFPALAGPAIALFSSVPLLARLLPRRVATTVPCAAALVWAMAAFVLLPDVFRGAEIPLFVLQGIILVAAAVAIVTTNADISARLADVLAASGRGLAARLGLAYPLAKRFRTALLLGMFALVVFTLTFLSVVSSIFEQQGPTFAEEARAGYDLLIDSNPANPVGEEQLLAQPGVVGQAPIVRTSTEFSTNRMPEGERREFVIGGFDERLLDRGAPTLSARDPEVGATDEEVFAALLADPSLLVVSEFFLQQGGGGPPESLVRIGDVVTMFDPASGGSTELTVVGTVGSDFHFNGALVRADALTDLFGPRAVTIRRYVAVTEGADAVEVADRLNASLLANGADARTFRQIVDRQLDEQAGFFRLFEGYLSLGLIIGIAGLGVVMVRAVRERRRQIGMLRAMGFSRRVVRAAFLFEAAFIAAQGILIGVALGLVASYSLLTQSSAFGDLQLSFAVPWGALAVIIVVPFLASLLAAAVPASKAAKTTPAVALRIAD